MPSGEKAWTAFHELGRDRIPRANTSDRKNQLEVNPSVSRDWFWKAGVGTVALERSSAYPDDVCLGIVWFTQVTPALGAHGSCLVL